MLRKFTLNGPDGYAPWASLAIDSAGNLYGTTSSGGADFGGTAFEFTPTAGGGWTEKVLHKFGKGDDGGSPFASPVLDAAGNLYGTTAGGGIDNEGTVFAIKP